MVRDDSHELVAAGLGPHVSESTDSNKSCKRRLWGFKKHKNAERKMERQTKTRKGTLKDANPRESWAGCPAPPLRPLQKEYRANTLVRFCK